MGNPARARRRSRQLWIPLGGVLLGVLRGLPTLKMFGRSREQVENLGRVSRRYGDATMDVLRTVEDRATTTLRVTLDVDPLSLL